MASSLRQVVMLGKRAWKKTNIISLGRKLSVSSKRQLLSESYACDNAWRKHLQDAHLNQVNMSDFGYEIRDRLEMSGTVSAVDMNVLVHQLNNMDDDEADFMEDLLARFNMCQSSLPHNDSTSHAIVRGFLAKRQDGSARLVRLLSQPLQYGLFPDHYSLNLLLDKLLDSGDFARASRVAYHTMLQEELGLSPVHTLLCLQAAVARLTQGPVSDLALPPPEKPDEEEEEDWIKVKYIKFPVYDDHFDIKDERFLLGKTLHMLAQVQDLSIPKEMATSLSVIGFGIHHKFSQGLAVLEAALKSSTGSVSQQALNLFSDSLENVEARDPEEPEVEIALRMVDDVIHRLLPTTKEKDEFQRRLGQLKEQLLSQGKVQVDFNLGSAVSAFVKSELPKYEQSDIENQVKRFSHWEEERNNELVRQVEDLKKSERIEEIKKQVMELQEQEELLSYFDSEEKIRLTMLEEDLAKDENLTIAK
ncbi:28S ribosomal protein S27, mitochondrial-like [Elysia marginata]|uniref:28S ribosomal protein S27, mitochondrial-like n=1 Tax=Elysia marginata TaxID=1093978 RepID=A0AAV4J1P6_9GAST|nr:28S ribosomal protein S27, mitochondrial-like [Elysia marginata]